MRQKKARRSRRDAACSAANRPFPAHREFRDRGAEPDDTRPRVNMRACTAPTFLRLPEELIAQTPLAERSASRLLVLDGASRRLRGPRASATCRSCSQPGDLLVFNDTRVVPARLFGSSPPAGASRCCSSGRSRAAQALVQLRASKPIREELEIATAAARSACVEKRGDLWRVELPEPALEFFERYGRGAAAALHPARAGRGRSRALPEHLRAARRRGGGAHREPAFRRRRCSRRSRRAACSARSSRCTSARARSSPCASMTSART